MLNWFATLAFVITTVSSSVAFACGAGFGAQLTITPSQTLIIRHYAGEETYIFNPDFCGAAADFGLILPIPKPLTSEPTLVDKQIFSAFEGLSAPTVVYQDVCRSQSTGGGTGGSSAAAVDGGSNGVNVINSGQVGIFDWSLLRADSSAAFTDWLDANQYPYDDKAVGHFAYYVTKSWYFIAFKVTAAKQRPTQGTTICGSFGPIRLGFNADAPVIPTRIATVGDGQNKSFTWRIHALTAKPMTINQSVFSQSLHYAGVITQEQLATFSKVATIAVKGDQLTSLDVWFRGSEVAEDITLIENPSGQTEYRQTITRYNYIECRKDPIPTGGVQANDGGCYADCGVASSVTQTDASTVDANYGSCLDCDEASTAMTGVGRDGSGCSIAHGSRTSSIPLFLLSVIGLVVYRRRRKRSRGAAPEASPHFH